MIIRNAEGVVGPAIFAATKYAVTAEDQTVLQIPSSRLPHTAPVTMKPGVIAMRQMKGEAGISGPTKKEIPGVGKINPAAIKRKNTIYFLSNSVY